jgi:hypothetical protein
MSAEVIPDNNRGLKALRLGKELYAVDSSNAFTIRTMPSLNSRVPKEAFSKVG